MSIDFAPPPSSLPPRFSDTDLRAARTVIVENVANAFAAGEMGCTNLGNLSPHKRQELEDKLRALSFHTDPAARWSAWEELVHEVTRQQQYAADDLDMETIPAHLRDHHKTVTAYLDCLVGEAVERLVGGR